MHVATETPLVELKSSTDSILPDLHSAGSVFWGSFATLFNMEKFCQFLQELQFLCLSLHNFVSLVAFQLSASPQPAAPLKELTESLTIKWHQSRSKEKIFLFKTHRNRNHNGKKKIHHHKLKVMERILNLNTWIQATQGCSFLPVFYMFLSYQTPKLWVHLLEIFMGWCIQILHFLRQNKPP